MQQRFFVSAIAVAIAVAGFACGKSEDPEEFAKKQAEKIQKEKYGDMKVHKIEVPVAGGKRIDCTDLVDITKFAEYLDDEVELKDFNKYTRQKDTSAVCKILRSGERPSKEDQAKLLAQHGKLGVLGGDTYCEIRYYCSLPEQKDFEKKCQTRPNASGNRDLGVYACVTMSQRGPDDAFRYKLVEPDTGCVLDVLGGDSVVGEEIPKACARAALESMKADVLEKYK